MEHPQQSRNKPSASSPEVAMASEVFDQFCNAATLKSILGHYRQLCDLLKIRPNTITQFYPKLKAKLRSWKAQALWKKFDQRANHKCYNRGKACLNTRVLIIGGGPCGLRSAIEAQLLGAKVVVVEKRDRMSRNNVLHLWPFVIQDLRGLGAKKFFGKFCAGSIDHISIRQLQCILLKVALILGVEFHENVSFDSLVSPPDNQEDGKIGWRAKTTPADHPVSQYEFDILIGADGKRNTLEGFKRKEFRGKLAIAITANFINKRTEAEARVEEISGVAFIFNQKFFKELYQETGIDLENIVYYKDDTHYFVMTAKKHSLIDKGVILQDHADTAKLLAKENVDREALMQYAREAAEFSTEYQMMNMEFAVNHYGQPDVAMFDFTSMYAAENASRILERHGHRLLMILVGDSLLEPFWPTGSGCARGFLSSLDACWAIKGWGSGTMSLLEVIAERESIYRLLGQTTPENLNRDYAAYTLDPHTRYPNLNVSSVTPIQIRGLLDTDDPESYKQSVLQSELDIPKKRRRRDIRGDSQVHPDTLLRWLQRQVALYDTVHIEDMGVSFKDGLALCAIIHRYRPDLMDFHNLEADEIVQNNQLAFDILEKELGISPVMTGDEMAQCDVPDKLAMFSYLTQVYEVFRGEIPHIRHRALELDEEDIPAYSKGFSQLTGDRKTQLFGRIAKQESTTSARHSRSRHNENILMDKKGDTIGRRSRKRRSTEKMGATVDREPKIPAGHRRNSIDEEFSGRIKSIEDKLKGSAPSEKKPRDLLRAIGKIEKTDWNVKEIEKKIEENKMGRGVKHDKVERVPKWSREQIKMEKKGRDQKETDSKYADIDNTLKNIDRKIREGNVLGHNKVSAMAEQFSNKNQDAEPKVQKSNTKTAVALPAQGGSEVCHFCNKRVYLMERLSAEGKFFHRGCFRCEYCSISLRIGNHTFDRERNGGRFYCAQHFGLPGTMKARAEKKRLPTVNKENIPTPTAKVKTPENAKVGIEGVVGLDLLDRGQTPERIEFENLAGISDAEEARSQMDEDEWTDRNFGASTAEMGSSDDISDMSDSDDDNEVYEEAIDQPLTTEGTLELAKNWTLRYSHPHATSGQSDTGSNEYEDSSDEYTSEEDDSETATEDEEDIRARELRKQEVWLENPRRPSDSDTGSETEVKASQGSIDNIIEEPTVSIQSTPTRSPDLILPLVLNVDDSKMIITEKVVSTESVLPNSNLSNAVITNAPQESKDTNPISEKGTAQAEPSESIILSDTTIIVPENQLNVENVVDDNVSIELIPGQKENTCTALVLYTGITYLDLVNNIAINSNVTSGMSNVNFDINIDDEKGSTTLSDETVQGKQLVIMLPDVMPLSEIDIGNTSTLEVAELENLDAKLPNLISSSAQNSKESSPSYSSEIYNSVEVLNDNTLTATDFSEKSTTEDLDFFEAEDVGNCTVNDDTVEKVELKIKSEAIDTYPIVTITSPSPTNEKTLEDVSIEPTKLTIPKETHEQPVKSSEDSSFDKLKRDLRQRKARNKLSGGELKPLSTESAQKKISKYFTDRRKSETKLSSPLKREISVEEPADDIKVVELNIKPKLSDKVEKKDIMKYFNKSQSLNLDNNHVSDNSKLESRNERERDVTIDEFNTINENDIDILNQLFNQIDEQTDDISLTSKEDVPGLLLNLKDNGLPENVKELKDKEKDNVSENVEKVEQTKDKGVQETIFTENLLNTEITFTDQKTLGSKDKDKDIIENKLPRNVTENYIQIPQVPVRRKILAKESAIDRNGVCHSDNTLSTRKQINHIPDISHRNSKSSFELEKNSAENLEIARVKVVEQSIQVPKLVAKLQQNTTTLQNFEEVFNGTPKKPERKNIGKSNGIQLNKDIVPAKNTRIESVPEAPLRRKPAKVNDDRSSSANLNLNLASDLNPSASVKSETDRDSKCNGFSGSSEITRKKSPPNLRPATPKNASPEQNDPNSSSYVSRHTPSVPECTKPVPPKNDRAKKDKCVASDDGSTEESENLATEISTDSEFEHDGVTGGNPTQHEIPQIRINDAFVRKTRGNYVEPKRVQVKSKVISSINGNLKEGKYPGANIQERIEEHGSNTVPTEKEENSHLLGSGNRVPLANPRKGDYLLNRTHSTEGIASKLSLELKKKYLLGSSAFGGTVMKSGSASNVDTKLRSLTDAISQHQKLLNPAPEPSPTMQAFLQGTSKLRTSNTQLSPISPTNFLSGSPIRPFTANRNSQNALANNNAIYKTSILPEAATKTPLPDLVKESSILKSKTAPNIACGESKKEADRELEEQVVPNQVRALPENSDSLKVSQKVNKTEVNTTTEVDETSELRPRSPLHETSIIVPQVDWSKCKDEAKEEQGSTAESEIDSDSLSSSDIELEEGAQKKQPLAMNLSPPRLQIHSTDGDLLLDESANNGRDTDDAQTFEPDSIECSYMRNNFGKDAKQPISFNPFPVSNEPSIELEAINNEIEQLELQEDGKRSVSNCSSPSSLISGISNKQDDSEENDVTTAALTETEFSEWARDGEVLVSDDLRDVEFKINPEFITTRRNKTLSGAKVSGVTVTVAIEEDLTDIEFDMSKSDDKASTPVNVTSKLLANGENIDYMDTDNDSIMDSLQDASNTALLRNRGYVEFVNIVTTPTNSDRRFTPGAPIARLEPDNDSCSEREFHDDKNIIEINPITMEDVKEKLYGVKSKSLSEIRQNEKSKPGPVEIVEEEPIIEAVNKELFQSMEEDSLLVIEPAEDTTTSEVITILASPVNPQVLIVPSLEAEESQAEQAKVTADPSNPDYLEYVKRLQSRIAEFSNAKDSIDIRKSKRKNSKSSLQTRTAEMITEEMKNQEITANNSYNSPATSRKLEEITKERSKQKNVIQDLLMDKFEAHRQKSAEKKARRAVRASSFSSTPGLSPIKPVILNAPTQVNKFIPTSIVSPVSSPVRLNFAEAKSSLKAVPTPEFQIHQNAEKEKITNKEENSGQAGQSKDASSTTKINNEIESNFKAPVAPPRLKHEEARRTAEKARQDARERARLKSDEDLGLSPEDKLKELRMKVARRQLFMEEKKKEEEPVPEPRLRLYSGTSTKTGLKLQTSKSTDNMRAIAGTAKFESLASTNAKSMDELMHATEATNANYSTSVLKRDKKKVKDPERRKSIIQAVSDFFFKKEASPSPSNQKLSVFRLSSKSKGKLDKIASPKINTRPKSICEGMLARHSLTETPPAIPPPPLNYNIPTAQVSDDSLSDDDTKTTAVSTSCTHRPNTTEGSCNSISRKSKTTKRIARQAQLKRLRMAQEIQRKLEETEVKQRELESRGVSVEKALRGEGDCSDREEADLLREWFDLMKERAELRRYEKELLVRAQEVQLEDRHERLQQELRERLADDDEKKTSADVKKEGEILTEMLEIVAKRDSLIALLEEERQRYQDEDRDLEAQMLAKGLRLTPIKKCGPKYSV